MHGLHSSYALLAPRCIAQWPLERAPVSVFFLTGLCVQVLCLAAESVGPVATGELTRLSLLVMPSTLCSEAATVSANGVVQVRTDCPATDLFSVVRALGPAAAEQLIHQERSEADLSELGRRVERALRLRSLTWDSLLSTTQATSGCQLLVDHANVLRQYLEGSSVRLACRNEMAAGRKAIDIAWDTPI